MSMAAFGVNMIRKLWLILFSIGLLSASNESKNVDTCKSLIGGWKEVRNIEDEEKEIFHIDDLFSAADGRSFLKVKIKANKLNLIFLNGERETAVQYAYCGQKSDEFMLTAPTKPSDNKPVKIKTFKSGKKICLRYPESKSQVNCFYRLTEKELSSLGKEFMQEPWE
jgi:hypothetical protein